MSYQKISKYKKILSELFKQTTFSNNSSNNVFKLFRNKNIILYGAGSGFITFSVFVLIKYGFKCSLVLDQKFKRDDSFRGVSAVSPLEYKPTKEEKNSSIVVITVGKKKYFKEIFRTLSNLGFKHIILATDIYEYHLHNSSKELENKGFDYFLQNKKKIIRCFDMLADDLSREVYVKFIQTHMQRKPIPIPHRPLDEQYFPKDLKLTKKNYSRFINCGAYHGETIIQCNKLFGKLDSIACFEPDLNNFELLSQIMLNHNKIAQSIVLFPCGVFNHETQLHFLSGNETNSKITDKGDSIVQCVALDHVIPNFKPTFISMDIEGAELEALKGAKCLINKNGPDLAISVYHTPSHLWDIPLYIDGLKLGYKFYLRNYSSFISETICYAML